MEALVSAGRSVRSVMEAALLIPFFKEYFMPYCEGGLVSGVITPLEVVRFLDRAADPVVEMIVARTIEVARRPPVVRAGLEPVELSRAALKSPHMCVLVEDVPGRRLFTVFDALAVLLECGECSEVLGAVEASEASIGLEDVPRETRVRDAVSLLASTGRAFTVCGRLLTPMSLLYALFLPVGGRGLIYEPELFLFSRLSSHEASLLHPPLLHRSATLLEVVKTLLYGREEAVEVEGEGYVTLESMSSLVSRLI